MKARYDPRRPRERPDRYPPSPLQARILTLLRAACGEWVKGKDLARHLWGEKQPNHPRVTISLAVSRLNGRLKEGWRIESGRKGYRYIYQPHRQEGEDGRAGCSEYC